MDKEGLKKINTKANRKELKRLGWRKQVKIGRIAKKLKLCDSCKIKALNPKFSNYCDKCRDNNKARFEKMNKISGE